LHLLNLQGFKFSFRRVFWLDGIIHI